MNLYQTVTFYTRILQLKHLLNIFEETLNFSPYFNENFIMNIFNDTSNTFDEFKKKLFIDSAEKITDDLLKKIYNDTQNLKHLAYTDSLTVII